jgi:hypothetical protein
VDQVIAQQKQNWKHITLFNFFFQFDIETIYLFLIKLVESSEYNNLFIGYIVDITSL